MPTARIEAQDDHFFVHTPFDQTLNKDLKAIPTVRWNKAQRAWSYDRTPAVARALRACLTRHKFTIDGGDLLAYATMDVPLASTKLITKDPPPWKHQIEATNMIGQLGASCIDGGMGTGKTRSVIDAITNYDLRRTLVLCPASVISVWPLEVEKYAAVDIRVVALRDGTIQKRTDFADKIFAAANAAPSGGGNLMFVINYEGAWRDPFGDWARVMPWDLVVMDECVPGDTMIATPEGDRPISELAEGDLVYGMDNECQVTETPIRFTFRRETSNSLVRVNDTMLTPNHPVWTTHGYVPAGDVSNFDFVTHIELKRIFNGGSEVAMRMVRAEVQTESQEPSDTILRKELLSPMAHVSSGFCGNAGHGTETRAGTRENEKSTATTRVQKETRYLSSFKSQSLQESCNCEKDQSQRTSNVTRARISAVERWQRQGANNPTETLGSTSRLADRTHHLDKAATTRFPDTLQDRYCRTDSQNRDRGRRVVPYDVNRKSQGQEERSVSSAARMDRSEISKSDCDRQNGSCDGGSVKSRKVFNLETGTGNYFANGLLVHNCHRIKSPTGRASLFCSTLRHSTKHATGLSGTLMPHGPADVFAEFRALDPGIYGDSYTKFKLKYITPATFKVQKDPSQPDRLQVALTNDADFKAIFTGEKKFKNIFSRELSLVIRCIKFQMTDQEIVDTIELAGDRGDRANKDVGWKINVYANLISQAKKTMHYPETSQYQNLDDLKARMDTITLHVSRDVLDLPDVIDVTRDVPLGKAERKLHNELFRDLIAWVESGEQVTAANALVKVLKLQQATSGYAKDDDGKIHEVGDSRAKVLQEVMEEAGASAGEAMVVFCRFHHDLDNVHAAAEAVDTNCLELSGRRNQLAEWQEGGAPILAVQIQSGGLGVDLTRARYAVFYSIGYSLGELDQAKARVHRPGQTRKVTNVMMVASKTIDEGIYRSLHDKRSIVDFVMSLVSKVGE
ncbi:hypothetical protein LCGC14_0320280 [marine sediment metagenome]|uniref:Hint domain-containing protein n=1 Tax=marine sediment metagenome TaxID=412755 RepID=A0A0F9TJN3_9ZZZZ